VNFATSFINVALQDTFDICRKTFSSGDEMLRMSLGDKIDLFFQDYSLVPLFAYENYIGAIPFSSRSQLFAVVVFGLGIIYSFIYLLHITRVTSFSVT